jgi:hypothetical protein
MDTNELKSPAVDAAELGKLKALAEAATQGEWTHMKHGVIVAGPFRQYTNGKAQSQIASFGVTNGQDDDAEENKQIPNADFCSAANPAAILRIAALVAQQAARIAELEASRWIPMIERLPEVKENDHEQFIVAVKRARNGQTYVFSAYYLNAMLLQTTDEDCPEEGTPFTGWHEVKHDDPDYDDAWVPLIDIGSGDEITHWQPLPAKPTATQEGK